MSDIHGAAQKRRRYTVAEKLQIMEDARTRSVAAASISSGASRSSIHEWMKHELFIAQYHPGTKRCSRGVIKQATLSTSSQKVAKNSEASILELPRPREMADDIEPRPPAPTRRSAQHNSHATLATSGDAVEKCATITSRTACGQLSSIGANQLTIGHDLGAACSSSVRTSRAVTKPTRSDHAKPSNNHTPRRAPDTILVAITGGSEGFTANAARKAFDDRDASGSLRPSTYNLVSYANVVHAMRALHQGEVDFAVVATETLWSAAYHAVLDKLVSFRLVIVAEIVSSEQTCASALPGTEMENIDCVISDWRVLEKHEDFILQLEELFHRTLVRQVTWGTSLACRIVREEQAPNTLVLCRKEAAIANGLKILQERVSSSHTRTSYTVIARNGGVPLRFRAPEGRGCAHVDWQQSAYMLYTTGEAVLAELVSVLARHDVQFDRFLVSNKGDKPTRFDQTIAVSYRSSVNAAAERELRRELIAVADRVVHLGNYVTYETQEQTVSSSNESNEPDR